MVMNNITVTFFRVYHLSVTAISNVTYGLRVSNGRPWIHQYLTFMIITPLTFFFYWMNVWYYTEFQVPLIFLGQGLFYYWSACFKFYIDLHLWSLYLGIEVQTIGHTLIFYVLLILCYYNSADLKVEAKEDLFFTIVPPCFSKKSVDDVLVT